MQMDHLIPTWGPDLVSINKRIEKTGHLVDFVILAGQSLKVKENKKSKNIGTLQKNYGLVG